MAQEDKELLMRDLSCRIPYGVIVNVYRMPNVKLTSVSWYDEVSVEDYHININHYTININHYTK